MEVVIVGAGAVGLALGSCLHRSAVACHFVLREGAPAHPMESSGFSRTGIFGDVEVGAEAIEVSRSLAALRGRAIDFVLVCTKTTATAEVAAALGDLWSDLPREPRIVLFQNGWGNAEQVAQWIPEERIFSARVITGFRLPKRQLVEVTVHADSIRIGSLFGADPAPLRPLADALDRGGIPTEVSDEIEKDLWAKLLYNCLLNPLGALSGVPYGALAGQDQTRSVMEAVAREIFAVMAQTGHTTHWASAEEYLETFYRDLLPPTADHESSMLQDLRAGRPTEIDALCGAVARLGAKHGVDTEVNRALTLLVHTAEQ